MSITIGVTTFASGNSNAMMNSRDRHRFNIQLTPSGLLTYNEVRLMIKFSTTGAYTIENVEYKIRYDGTNHLTEYMVNSGGLSRPIDLSTIGNALSVLNTGAAITLNLDLKTGIHFVSARNIIEFDPNTDDPYRTPPGTINIEYSIESVDIATPPSSVTSVVTVGN